MTPTPPDIALDLFALALRRHQAGDLDRAEHLYRQALQADPGHADAWHGLGVLASQRGRPDRAFAEAYGNLGHVLYKQGKLAEALANLREAVRLKPDLAAAHNELGATLGALGLPPEAGRHLQQALWLEPDHPEANNKTARLSPGTWKTPIGGCGGAGPRQGNRNPRGQRLWTGPLLEITPFHLGSCRRTCHAALLPILPSFRRLRRPLFYPENAELLLLEALVLREQGDFPAAEARLLRLLAGQEKGYFTSVAAGQRGYEGRYHLAAVYQEMCRHADAEAQRNLAVLLRQQGRAGVA
jgi:tetratricopeptide (TPR) repeat protein